MQLCEDKKDAEFLAIQEEWNRIEKNKARRLIFVQIINILSSALASDLYSCKLRQRLLRWMGARISPTTRVSGGGFLSGCRLITGDNCYINRHYYFDVNAPIVLGNNVCIGHGVTFIKTNHEKSNPNQRAGKQTRLPMIVEDGVWIAANATLLPEIIVGKGAIVAAGAVVTKNASENSLVVGIPARVIKTLNS